MANDLVDRSEADWVLGGRQRFSHFLRAHRRAEVSRRFAGSISKGPVAGAFDRCAAGSGLVMLTRAISGCDPNRITG
jgi:hypothetical protein